MKKLNMKHLISIKKMAPNDGPEPGEQVIEIAKSWAAIRTLQGKEIQAMGITLPVENVRFIIRYIPGINSDMQIHYNGRVYKIENVMNDNEDDKTLTIIAHTKEKR